MGFKEGTCHDFEKGVKRNSTKNQLACIFSDQYKTQKNYLREIQEETYIYFWFHYKATEKNMFLPV